MKSMAPSSIPVHYQAVTVGLDRGDVTVLTNESLLCLFTAFGPVGGIQVLLKHHIKSSEHSQVHKNHMGEKLHDMVGIRPPQVR